MPTENHTTLTPDTPVRYLKGVGPKTAKELLEKFGSLDGVYAHLDDPSIRPKLREKLEAGKENAYLSFDLATIRPEAPIEFAPKDAIVQPYNRSELYQLFQKLEFVRLIDKYGLRGAADAPKPEQKIRPLPRREDMPGDVDGCAVYLAGDGSVGLAWAEGVCALTPMEAQMGQLSLAGKKLIFHDSKAAMHRLDELGKLTDAVNGMNTNIKLTIQQLENTNKSLEIVTAQNKKQEDRLTALEKAPGTFGNKLWWAVIAALVSGLVAYELTMLLH